MSAEDHLPDGPWMWYRADDIPGSDGDKIAFWADRSGNGIDLYSSMEGPSTTPVLRSAALNGQPGLDFESYTSETASNCYPFYNFFASKSVMGLHVVQVFSEVHNIFSAENTLVQLSDPSFPLISGLQATGSPYIDRPYFRAETETATWWLEATSDLLPVGPSVLTSKRSASGITVVANGEATVSEEPLTSLTSGQIRVGGGGVSVLLDTLIYDRALTEDEECGLQNYIYERYALGSPCGDASAIPLRLRQLVTSERLIQRDWQGSLEAPRLYGPGSYH